MISSDAYLKYVVHLKVDNDSRSSSDSTVVILNVGCLYYMHYGSVNFDS